MSDIVQQIIFTKAGLNTDDAVNYLPVGDSPYRLGIMISEDASNGTLTLLKGNEQIAYDHKLILSNVYFCLGSYYNDLTRSLYFFIFSLPYDSGGDVYLYDNRLLRLNEDSLTIDDIFLDTKNYFGLDPKHYLTDIRMLNTWLFFNPVTDQPKMIDVEMAYNYTNYPAWDDSDTSASARYGDKYTWRGGLFVANKSISAGQDPSAATTKWDRIGSCYQDESTIGVTEFDRAFFAIKVPPVDRVSLTYGTDTTSNFNNIKGRVFRFTHRYQYFDNAYSVCSAHSDLSLPIDDEIYSGEKILTTTFNNYIQVSLKLYSAALVKNIEVFFQELGGDWKRAVIINRQQQSTLDDVNYSFKFYNNESYPVIEQEIPTRIYDAVPKLTASQEIINKNVLCYARCTEGFDNIDKDVIDVTLTATRSAITAFTGQDTLKRENIGHDITTNSFFDDSSNTWFYYTIIDIKTWFGTAGIISGDVYKGCLDGIVSYKTFVAGDVDSALHLANAIASVYQGATVFNNGTVINVQLVNNFGYPDLTISRIYSPEALITATSSLTKYKGFKTGAYHPFCLFYYDEAMRRGDAQLNTDMSVYVPALNEGTPAVTTNSYKYDISWKIYHEPPTWATYWRWGYAGNRRCTSFVQYIILSIADSVIDITPLQSIRTTTNPSWNCYPNSDIPQYQFTVGDRVKFLTKKTNPSVSGTKLGDLLTGIYDYEIIKFDETKSLLYIESFDYNTPEIGANTLIEIYTPVKDATALENTKTLTYYEFGELFPIVFDPDGNRVHAGKSQNQDLTASPIPAEGTFESGDIYLLYRTPSRPLCDVSGQTTAGAFHEAMWWSDFYNSNDWNKGKLGLESLVGEVSLNVIRYSDVYLQDTQINGLTTFRAASLKEINDTFGRIISIIEVGDTLKCYQERKPSSIQIGRTEYYDTSGVSANVQTQSFVLGSIRYSNTNYGTVFPESISKNNRYVYGFDIYNGLVWRDSANGIFPISGRYVDANGADDYKMMSYFKAKAKVLLASGITHCRVLTVWDEEYKMLFVNFQDGVNEVNNDTIVFHEPTNRWITFTEFEYTPPTSYGQLIEPTFEIVKGFETGIGYSFDKESRFHCFDIGKTGSGSGQGTTKNMEITVLNRQQMILEVPLPAISSEPYINPATSEMVFSAATPMVGVTSVSLTDIYKSWQAIEYGIPSKQNEVVTIVGSTDITIKRVPSWLTVGSNSLGLLQEGDNIYAYGDTLYIYPTDENFSGAKSGLFIIEDAFGNSHSITVIQQQHISRPIATLAIRLSDQEVADNTQSPLTLYGEWGTLAYIGSPQISVYFALQHADLSFGDTFRVYYAIFVNGVLDSNSTSQYLDVQSQIANDVILYMANDAQSGNQITVYFSADHVQHPQVPVDANIHPSSIGLVLSNPAPVVLPTYIEVTPSTAISFLWNDEGLTKAIAVTMTVVGCEQATIEIPISEWVYVFNAVENTQVSMAYDDDVLYIVPTANYGQARSFDIRFRGILQSQESGDSAVISVSQAAADVETELSVSVLPDPDRPYGSLAWAYLEVLSPTGRVTSGSTEIYVTFVIEDISLEYGRRMSLNYYVTKTIDDSVYIVGDGILYEVQNRVPYSATISMTTIAENGCSMTVYLSENVIF